MHRWHVLLGIEAEVNHPDNLDQDGVKREALVAYKRVFREYPDDMLWDMLKDSMKVGTELTPSVADVEGTDANKLLKSFQQ